jgi:hypothetical protein
MLLEYECNLVSQVGGLQSSPVSPPYVPVSQDWLPLSSGEKVQTTSELQDSISR